MKPKVLMFHHEPLLAEMYNDRFLEVGFESKVFYSYVDPPVVDLVAEEKPDIIWCSIMMHKLSEIEQEIKNSKGKPQIPPRIPKEGIKKEESAIWGWEAVELLKKDKRTKDIPVIIVTNFSQPEERERGLRLGATDYLLLQNHTPIEIIEIFKRYCIKK